MLPGATIKLKKLPVVQMQSGADKAQLTEQLQSLEHSLTDLKAQRDVAADVAGKQAERDALYEQLMAQEAALKRYEQYQVMQRSQKAQQALMETLNAEQEEVDGYLSEVQQSAAGIADSCAIVNSR